jgi:hypothetical protein
MLDNIAQIKDVRGEWVILSPLLLNFWRPIAVTPPDGSSSWSGIAERKANGDTEVNDVVFGWSFRAREMLCAPLPVWRFVLSDRMEPTRVHRISIHHNVGCVTITIGKGE